MRGKTAGVGVGTISILAIFVILCLTMFATLSMVSARSELALAQRTAQAATRYYEADSAAQEAIAQLLSNPQNADGWTQQPDGSYYSAFALTEERELQVQVAVMPDGVPDILRYQVVGTGQALEEVPLPVLTEESLFGTPHF